jgi:Na+/phosphate symporter
MSPHDAPDAVPESTPAERLRALELSGDPDAVNIARAYKSTPLEGVAPAMRQVARAMKQTTAVFRPTYAQATEADADDAEKKVASMRARRESERRAREQQMHRFAEAADRREQSMLTLTRASVAVALVSLFASGAALVISVISA